MAKGIETLSRFVARNDPVLDFCAGTCSLGLASLYMNQRFVVLNDRDKAQLQYAEARLRAYLWAMTQSPLWREDDSGNASMYTIPGEEVHTTWDGRDPYMPLLAALRRDLIYDKIIIAPNNKPSSMTQEKMAFLYDCEVKVGVGVFTTTSQQEGFSYPMYGEYKRTPGNMEENQINSIILKSMHAEKKPFYLRVSDECPWKHVRAPTKDEDMNCVKRTCVTWRIWPRWSSHSQQISTYGKATALSSCASMTSRNSTEGGRQ